MRSNTLLALDLNPPTHQTASDCSDCPYGHFKLSGPCHPMSSRCRKLHHKNKYHVIWTIFIIIQYSYLLQLQAKYTPNMTTNSATHENKVKHAAQFLLDVSSWRILVSRLTGDFSGAIWEKISWRLEHLTSDILTTQSYGEGLTPPPHVIIQCRSPPSLTKFVEHRWHDIDNCPSSNQRYSW
jgi:hypothetical protein